MPRVIPPPSDHLNFVYKTPVKSSIDIKPNTRTKSFKAEAKYMNILAPISENTKKVDSHFNKSLEKSKNNTIPYRAPPATVEKEKSMKLQIHQPHTTSTKKVAPRRVEFLQAPQSVLVSKSSTKQKRITIALAKCKDFI